MAHHVLGDGHVVVDLAVVDLELEPYEVGQDGRGTGLRADWYDLLPGLWSDNGETGDMVGKC